MEGQSVCVCVGGELSGVKVQGTTELKRNPDHKMLMEASPPLFFLSPLFNIVAICIGLIFLFRKRQESNILDSRLRAMS